MLKTNTPYQELGDDYFDRINPDRIAKKLIHRLESLGLQVQVSPRHQSTP